MQSSEMLRADPFHTVRHFRFRSLPFDLLVCFLSAFNVTATARGGGASAAGGAPGPELLGGVLPRVLRRLHARVLRARPRPRPVQAARLDFEEFTAKNTQIDEKRW